MTVAAFTATAASSGNTFSAAASFGGCTASTFHVAADGDTWVSQENPTTNFGTGAFSTAVLVRSFADNKGGKNYRALVRFSLPAKPASCVLSSAFLRLRQYQVAAARTVQALPAASAWNEATVTWDTQPTTTGPAATPYLLRTGWTEWLVTTLVEQMYAGSNHGFVLRDSVEDSATGGGNNFYSRDAAAPAGAAAPELVLRFADAACATPGPAAEALAEADTYLNEAAPTTNFGTATDMNVRSQIAGNQRLLMDFTLPAIPGGCAPVTGQMRAYTNTGGTGRTLELYGAASSWTEGGATWATQPATAGAPVATQSANTTLHPWNLTSTFLAALYAADHGLVVKDSAEGNGTAVTQIFDTREKSGGTPPRLIVTFG